MSEKKKEQIKILCLGDPHYLTENLTATSIMEDEFFRHVEIEKPDIIVVMGDTLDRFENIHSPTQARATYFLRELQNEAHLFLLIGNHDRPVRDDYLSDIHPFVAAKWWDNTTVVDDVTVIEKFGFKFCLVPYVPKGRYMEALGTKKITPDNIKDFDCFFSHQEFNGSKFGVKDFSDSTDKWSDDWPLNANGHIHEYQIIKPNLINVGTSYMTNFGEKNTKGLSLFTLTKKDDKTTFVETRLDVSSVIKENIEITIERYNVWKPPYTLEEMKEKNIKIKLKVTGPKEKLDVFRKMTGRKKKLRNHYVYVVFINDIERPEKLGYLDKYDISKGKQDFKQNLCDVAKGESEDVYNCAVRVIDKYY